MYIYIYTYIYIYPINSLTINLITIIPNLYIYIWMRFPFIVDYTINISSNYHPIMFWPRFISPNPPHPGSAPHDLPHAIDHGRTRPRRLRRSGGPHPSTSVLGVLGRELGGEMVDFYKNMDQNLDSCWDESSESFLLGVLRICRRNCVGGQVLTDQP